VCLGQHLADGWKAHYWEFLENCLRPDVEPRVGYELLLHLAFSNERCRENFNYRFICRERRRGFEYRAGGQEHRPCQRELYLGNALVLGGPQ